MKRKLTIIALCMILVIGLLPASAFADPGTTPQHTSYGRAIIDGVTTYDVTYNEAGTVRFVLLRSDMAQPTNTQVNALQDAGGNAVSSPYSGSVACTAGTETVLPIDLSSLAPNKYNIFVVCDDGYGNISSVLWLQIDGSLSFEITERLTFHVTDGTDPIPGATVKIGSTTQTTDASGDTIFTLSGGDYTYLVQKEGYAGVWGSFTTDAQTDTKTITLSADGEGYYSAILNIKDDEGTNLKNARVTIGADTQTADSGGNVEFFLEPGEYSYTASAMGRITSNGDFTVGSANFTGNVVLATDPAGVDLVINSHQKGRLGNEIDAILSANSLGADAVRSLTVHGGVMDSDDFGYTGIKKLYMDATNVFTSVDLSDTTLDGNVLPEATFYYARHLNSVVLPDSVTEIGESAFAYTALTSFTFGDQVTTVGGHVFESTPLESITFPAGITSIGEYVFSSYGWGAAPVKDVTMLTTDPGTITTINGNSFFSANNIALHVPDGSATAYYSDARDGDATDKKWFGMYICDPAAAPPVIKGSYSGWWNATLANFGFQSDSPGEYYYAIVEDGATEPEIDTSGTGDEVDSDCYGYKYLTGLTDTPKDIYIVLKDFNGKLSNKLKMDLPAADAAPVDVNITGHVNGNLADEINAELTEWGMSYNYNKVAGLTVSGGSIGSADSEFLYDYVYNITAADFSGTSFEGNVIPADFLYYSETLKTIVLPGSVQAIGDEAFCELDVLESITILGGSTPPALGEYVFDEVPAGAVVIVPRGSKDAYLAAADGNTTDNKWYGLTVVEYPQLASSVSDGTIFVAGRITLTPNVGGGTWEWDHTFFSATFNSPATFTALKAGTSTITYTVSGISESYIVTIRPAEFPSTGQELTWVYVLCGAALLAAGLAAWLMIRRRKAAKA